MSIKRHDAKRDKNEPVIFEALQMAGAMPIRISEKGLPDLAVLFRGETFWLEVKTDKGKLTPAQIDWHATALNYGVNVYVVHSVHDALKAIGAIDD